MAGGGGLTERGEAGGAKEERDASDARRDQTCSEPVHGPKFMDAIFFASVPIFNRWSLWCGSCLLRVTAFSLDI